MEYWGSCSCCGFINAGRIQETSEWEREDAIAPDKLNCVFTPVSLVLKDPWAWLVAAERMLS